MAAPAAPKKMPGIAPKSNKDPKKVAQQLRDGHVRAQTLNMLKSDGQWSSEDIIKADQIAENKLYHIHQGPHRITYKPLTLNEIRNTHGPIQKLESSGFTLIPHEPKPKKN